MGISLQSLVNASDLNTKSISKELISKCARMPQAFLKQAKAGFLQKQDVALQKLSDEPRIDYNGLGEGRARRTELRQLA